MSEEAFGQRLRRARLVASARCLVEPAGAPPLRNVRSDCRLDPRDLLVIEEVGDWLADYAWLEQAALGAQRYEFPTCPLPSGDVIEQGECLAGEERSRLALGDDDPIPSMVALLEREGVKVAVQPFHPKSRAFGCFLFSEALGPCVIVNRDRTPAERRLAAAHEYAHLLVDEEDVSGEVCGPFRAHELDELRAGAFAAAFLLPAGGIAATLEGVDAPGEVTPEHVIRLGHDFGASYRGVVARLATLGWVDDRHRARLERRTRAAHRDAPAGPAAVGGPSHVGREPGDTETEPVRFRSVAVEAWHCGRISTGKLAGLLGLPEADVALLLDQPLLEHEARP